MRNCIVLGTGRSGTSLLCGCLTRSGWWSGDDHYPPRDSNPTGFFESAWVNQTNEALLRTGARIDPDLGPGALWLHSGEDLTPPPNDAWKSAVESRVKKPFALKDPRFTWTLPAWESALGSVAKLVVHRNPAHVVASTLRECATQDYLRGVRMDEARALKLWTRHYTLLLEQAQGRDDWCFVAYEDLLNGRAFQTLSAFLGAPVDGELVDPKLQRNRIHQELPPEVEDLARRLSERGAHDAGVAPLAARPRVGERQLFHRGPPAHERPQLSVLISTLERREVLLGALEHFDRQETGGRPFELVITDDQSPDGSLEAMLGRSFRNPTTILSRPKASLASARNDSIRLASGRLLLIVNDDTLAQPGLLREHLQAHDDFGAPCSVLGRFDQPAEHLDNALLRRIEHSHFGFPYKDMEDGGQYGWEKHWTCNISSPANAVRSAGMFDEGFETYGCEDSDLGVRLQRAGLPVVFRADAHALHDHVLTLDDVARRQHSLARANVHFFHKHPDLLATPAWRWLAAFQRPAIEAKQPQWARFLEIADPPLRKLSEIRLSALEQQEGSEACRTALRELGRLLAPCDRIWWAQGVLQGLNDLQLDALRMDSPAMDAPQALAPATPV